MSIPLNILRITQNDIDVIGSRESVITPKKLVGESYVEGSNYIFEINENITINKGQTLKDFKNIIVKHYAEIKNGGTIDNCTITLNTNKTVYNWYHSKILNGFVDNRGNKFDGNINNCTITVNNGSGILNGNGGIGNIIGSNITFNDGSGISNGDLDIGNIINGNITFNDESYINNGINSEGNIIGCTITLSNDSHINNSYIKCGNISNCTITLIGSSKIYNGYYFGGIISNSYIFIHNEATLQNFYNDRISTRYGILTNTYIFAFGGKIQNTYNGNSGTFNSTILKFSNDCEIDKTIDDKKIYIVLNKTKMNGLNSITKQLNNTSRNNISRNVTNKDNTLNKLLLINHLTQLIIKLYYEI